ncbi:hypothetical protein LLG90_19040 [Aromatoleum toluclasticum]|uniref:hypothetical protein n=1 Tax=Aromatoleum toluclasticum TaxID=92003 RepID=UPI00037D0593|nr:hypothetical protein [Aromatoleum toluclasticum]MCC4117456.1 hypothetical protein [Aromatoleum toluclasticum]
MSRTVKNPEANSLNAGEGGYAVVEGPCPSPLRTAAILLARYQIRSLRRLFEEFERDILLPLLLGEIALHNIGSLENSGEVHVGVDGDKFATVMRPCNAYSIAAATGLPRETVRRKIVRLVELGWITRRGNGHLFLTQRAIEHFGALLGSRDLPELLDTADRIRKRMQD